MNSLKLIIIFGVLLETRATVEVNKSEENVSFSVHELWRSYRKKNECTCSCDDWKEGVQKYYDGTLEVAKKLSARTYDEAETVMTTFQTYLSKLIYFTNSNSTVLSPKSTAILDALSKCSKVDKSPTNILKESEKALPQLIEDYTKIVSSLSKVIGELTCPINDALIDLAGSIAYFIKEFFEKNVDKKAGFQPVIKRAQILINTIALIAETALKECDLATSSVYEALTVLSLILIHLLLSVQGVNICTQEILHLRSRDIPVALQSCLLPINNVVKEMVDSVVSITVAVEKTITAFLTKLVDLTIFLNSIFDELVGLFAGVTITVGKITNTLAKSLPRNTNAFN